MPSSAADVWSRRPQPLRRGWRMWQTRRQRVAGSIPVAATRLGRRELLGELAISALACALTPPVVWTVGGATGRDAPWRRLDEALLREG